MKFKTSYKFK